MLKEAYSGYTVEARQRALAGGAKLPRAVRKPSEMLATSYVYNRLRNVKAVRRFLDAPRNERLLQGCTKIVLKHALEDILPHQRFDVRRRITDTFGGVPKSKHSVENWVALIKTMEGLPDAADRHRAREHLDVSDPGPYWQLWCLTVLDGVIERSGQQGILGPRSATNEEDSRCVICLDTLAEKGTGSTWMQFEPCRHWCCSNCGRAQLDQHGMTKCALCRSEILFTFTITAE